MLIVNCRITDVNGTEIDTFSIDHHAGMERAILGARCTKAFEAGHKVETWPVSYVVKDLTAQVDAGNAALAVFESE